MAKAKDNKKGSAPRPATMQAAMGQAVQQLQGPPPPQRLAAPGTSLAATSVQGARPGAPVQPQPITAQAMGMGAQGPGGQAVPGMGMDPRAVEMQRALGSMQAPQQGKRRRKSPGGGGLVATAPGGRKDAKPATPPPPMPAWPGGYLPPPPGSPYNPATQPTPASGVNPNFPLPGVPSDWPDPFGGRAPGAPHLGPPPDYNRPRPEPPPRRSGRLDDGGGVPSSHDPFGFFV